jgi:signal transduction histidine kinase
VRVRLILEEDYVVVRIEDNGSGVPEGVRSSVFQPFVSEGKQNGTGLGLTFAFQVAQDHGGSISIERSSPGDTCFRFSISRVKMTPFEPPVDNSVADSAAAWGGSLDA